MSGFASEASAPRPRDVAQDMTDTLHGAITRIHRMVARVEAFADNLTGPAATQLGASTPRIEAIKTAPASTQQVIVELDRALEQLHAALTRLDAQG